MTTGYSGTPLATKLGVKSGQQTWRLDMPSSVVEEIAATGVKPILLATPEAGLEMAHLFLTRRHDLAKQLVRLRKLLAPTGILWISWPKGRRKSQPTSPKTWCAKKHSLSAWST